MNIPAPKKEELSNYYQSYLGYLTEQNLLDALNSQSNVTSKFISGLTEEQANYAYAPGKWSIKEVIGHLCDTERILVYRALRIARKDLTPIEGFDENWYIPNSNYSLRSLSGIFKEWQAIRLATQAFFSNIDASMAEYSGTANSTPVTVKALLYFIIVHERHHLKVLQERYLNS
ncbi:MAG: DinB family protein [Bacteroidia bacterium]